MTTKTSQIGHPTLTLKQISPKVSPAFSPNLHRWMSKKAHFYTGGGVLTTVFRVTSGSRWTEHFGEGTLMIGYLHDGDFMGVRLMAALCEGAAASSFCYTAVENSFVQVEGFWERYLEVGRCAIDPEHKEGFMDARYTKVGDTRTCLWCGAKHERVMTPRTVFDESWQPQA